MSCGDPPGKVDVQQHRRARVADDVGDRPHSLKPALEATAEQAKP